jgi:hypothetical protein
MNKLYFYFFYIVVTIILLVLSFATWYSVSPDWISKNIINNYIPHETKIFIRNNFIKKNLKKHINTIEKNQFIKLDLNKFELGFDYNYKQKNLKHNVYQDVAHIDTWDNYLLLSSSEGSFYFFKNEDLVNFNNKKKRIDTNLRDLNFVPTKGFSVKDILVNDNYVYVSYVEIKKKGCLSIVIEKAKIDLEYLKFEKFFNPEECVDKSDVLGNVLHPGQAGGRIAALGKTKILLTTGNFRSPTVSQNNNSIYGKILEIDKDSGKFEIFSKGHRNPQGLYADEKNILSTEHGPYGGDEINLIKKDGNYGFPIASYGEPYSYKNSDKNFYYKKSHDGFNEPIFTFIPSIGISQIIKLPNSFNKKWKDNYLLSSLAGNSIYRIKFSKSFDKIIFYETIYIGERVRDIIYGKKNNFIYLILEETASLGILFSK